MKGRLMAWTITQDLIGDSSAPLGTNLNALGRTSGTFPQNSDSILAFRLLDDDDNLYYEGVVIDDENILDVLDWAQSNAGATQMLVTNNGVVWKHV